MPTFVALAGGTIPLSRRLDGYNIWEALIGDADSPRTEILHNIDPGAMSGTNGAIKRTQPRAAVRVGDYKLIIGQSNSGWGANPSPPFDQKIHPDPEDHGPWMFNVRVDPRETANLWAQPAFAVQQRHLEAALARYNASAVPCRLCVAMPDPKAAPRVVDGLEICTPAPVNESDMSYGSRPIMCQSVGVWQPWQDNE